MTAKVKLKKPNAAQAKQLRIAEAETEVVRLAEAWERFPFSPEARQLMMAVRALHKARKS